MKSISASTQNVNELTTAIGSNAAFEKLFCKVLMDVREVGADCVRWEFDGGPKGYLDQQQRNVKLLLTTIRSYDVSLVAKGNRDEVQRQVDRLQTAERAYNASLRKKKGAKGFVSELCASYADVLRSGRQFCSATVPHLTHPYDVMFGSGAEIRN